MKKKLLAFILLASALSTQAQTSTEIEQEHKSLFKGIKPTFGIIDIMYNQAEIQGTALPGFALTGGAVFNDFWMVGLHMDFAVTSDLSMGTPPVEVVNPRYSTYFIALQNELILFPRKALSISFPLRVGIAGVSYVDKYFQGQNNNAKIDQESFFMAEPGMKLNLNLWPNVGITAGAGYRLAAGVDRAGTNDDFSAPVFNAGVRFKLFE